MTVHNVITSQGYQQVKRDIAEINRWATKNIDEYSFHNDNLEAADFYS